MSPAKSFFCFVLFLFMPVVASAYIPPYWMILSRTAENHGRGPYQIEQSVVFNHGQEPLIVNEKWWVMGENSMRLEVTGRKQLKDRIRLTYIYQNGRRYFIDENGVKKSERASDNFFEPFFHFRFSKNIKPILVAQNIAPAASLKSEAHKYSQKRPLPEPESYIRLARTGGAVTYAIGIPSPPEGDALPGLWIEQDQFNIRKIRLLSKLEISANQYKVFSQNLNLPQERVVAWNGQAIRINLNEASAVSAGPKIKALFENTSLNFGENPKLSRLLPEDAVIQDFYSQLR